MKAFNNIKGLKPFFEPQSIAIIGLSRKTGKGEHNALQNLLDYGYDGRIYPVNPNASEILGVKTYSSVKDIEGPVDLAVLVTPRTQVPMHVRNCAEKGIKCITIVTQGFMDAGDAEGMRLSGEMLETADAHGCRILGPNSFGSANAFFKFGSSFARVNMQPNPLGFICQSGGLFNGLSEYSFVGKAIDVGNICNVDFADCLEYFEQDPQVKVILLHIEGMPDLPHFLIVAGRVSRKKPIIAIKTGKSAQAARAAQSHTGSLAGKNEIWDAAFKQAGIMTVDSLEELVDTARVLCMVPLVRKEEVCIVTFSGGTAIMALDGLRGSNLKVGSLSPATLEGLKKLAPPWLPVGNPVDYWPMVMGVNDRLKLTEDIFRVVLEDDKFGSLLFIQIIHDEMQSNEFRLFLNKMVAEYPDKPIVTSLVGPYGAECVKELQAEGRVLAFHAPERAAYALATSYRCSQQYDYL
ncbi:MAG: CoA-binding protein [Dehalococcoidia bacterium]|nr:CoA-binding protein [Dehalococcoidia bacterium]